MEADQDVVKFVTELRAMASEIPYINPDDKRNFFLALVHAHYYQAMLDELRKRP